MESLIALINMCIEFMKTEITVYGFTFSFWGIFIFTIVASIAAYVVGGIFFD